MANFLPNDNTDPRIDIIWAKNKSQSHLKRCKADVYSEATFHKHLLSRLIKMQTRAWGAQNLSTWAEREQWNT